MGELICFSPGASPTLIDYFNKKLEDDDNNLVINDLGADLFAKFKELERQRSTVQSVSPRIFKVLKLPLPYSEKLKVFQLSSRILFSAALRHTSYIKVEEENSDKMINHLFESYGRELNQEDSKRMELLEKQLRLAYQTLDLIPKERRTFGLARDIVNCFTDIRGQQTLESLFQLFTLLNDDKKIEHLLSHLNKLAQAPVQDSESLTSRRDSLIQSLLSLLNNETRPFNAGEDVSRLIDTGIVLSLLPIDDIDSQSADSIHQLFEYMEAEERQEIIKCLSEEKVWRRLNDQLRIGPWINEIFNEAKIYDSQCRMACFLILNALDLKDWEEEPVRLLIHCYSSLRKDQLLNLLKPHLRSKPISAS